MKPNKIPKMPPMALVNTEIYENIPAPKKAGIYPPIIEPIIIPKKTKDLVDTY